MPQYRKNPNVKHTIVEKVDTTDGLFLPTVDIRRSVFAAINNNSDKVSLSEFRKGLLDTQVAGLEPLDHPTSLKRAFFAADEDNNGFITLGEFKQALEYAIYFHRLKDVIDAVDAEGDGKLTEDEFAAICRRLGPTGARTDLHRVFEQMDCHRSGFVRFSDLCSWVARTYAREHPGDEESSGQNCEPSRLNYKRVNLNVSPTYMDDSNKNDNESDISHSSLDKMDVGYIHYKVDLYNNLLKKVLDSCTMKKNGLDMYYERLTSRNNAIQTSVIALSVASTFIQSLSNNKMDNYIPIITLCISSYSGFMLAIAKFFKFEELKENVHNLRDRFAELHSRIKYYRDLIYPWYNQSHYKHFREKEKTKYWNVLIDRLDTEYENIIDTKKGLFARYEKVIDTSIARKYDVKFLHREVRYVQQKGRLSKNLDKIERKYDMRSKEGNQETRPRGIVSSDMNPRGIRREYVTSSDEEKEKEEEEEEEKCCIWSCCKRKKKDKTPNDTPDVTSDEEY